MSTLAPPNVRLHLPNRPENISHVRAMLAGVAEAIDLSREQLDDITTAVTEAANNVVLHAYAGDLGPLEVDVCIAEGVIEVVVRDDGIGIQSPTHALDGSAPAHGEIDEGGLALGLPIIQALAAHVEFHNRTGRGTEVRMQFATPGIAALDARPHDDFKPFLDFPLVELFTPELLTAATIAITPARLARTVLPRLLGALAARANFSTDRLSDAQLLADVIAAQAFQSIIGSHLGVGIAIEPRQVELRIGPLPATSAHGIPVDSVLGELAPIVEKLADHHSLAPLGPAAVLALQLLDPDRPLGDARRLGDQEPDH